MFLAVTDARKHRYGRTCAAMGSTHLSRRKSPWLTVYEQQRRAASA